MKSFFFNCLVYLSKIFAITSRNWENESLILSAKAVMNSDRWNSDLSNDVFLEDKEFKVYSQWGDDGIIQYLIEKLNIQNKFFIEFGVSDFYESNSHFLMVNNNWSGFVIDGSEKNINRLKKTDIYWRYNLNAICSFITKSNINKLISENVDHKIGMLHIDLDGNDYWILQQINLDQIEPDIVILEYNYIFGIERSITIPYSDDFNRFKNHHSGLFFGASLKALIDSMEDKNYYFIGTNSARNNAYFLKNKYHSMIRAQKPKQKHIEAKFRISRDQAGSLDYRSDDKLLKDLRGLKVHNTISNEIEEF